MSRTLFHSNKLTRNHLAYDMQMWVWDIEMGKLKLILNKLNSKISWKYLLFIFIIIIGCSYQVIQVIQVYLEFETKIDVKYDDQSEIAIPKVSLCKPTTFLMRNSSLRYNETIIGLSPAQLYNMTFNFKEIVVQLRYYNGTSSPYVEKFKDAEHQIKSIIHYEKTISLLRICYHFKYSNVKQIKAKNIRPFHLQLSHRDESIVPYNLYLSSSIDYKLNAAKSLQIFGN